MWGRGPRQCTPAHLRSRCCSAQAHDRPLHSCVSAPVGSGRADRTAGHARHSGCWLTLSASSATRLSSSMTQRTRYFPPQPPSQMPSRIGRLQKVMDGPSLRDRRTLGFTVRGDGHPDLRAPQAALKAASELATTALELIPNARNISLSLPEAQECQGLAYWAQMSLLRRALP